MRKIISDESGTLWAWVEVLLGLFILLVAYVVGVPLDNFIAKSMIELGAPLAPTEFLQKLLVWTFVGMGVLLMLFGYASSYKKTSDTGVYGDELI